MEVYDIAYVSNKKAIVTKFANLFGIFLLL